MTRDQILGIITKIIAERLGVDEARITLESSFTGDLEADSLDLVEIIMALEQEFDIEIKDDDAENIRTVGEGVEFVFNRLEHDNAERERVASQEAVPA